MLEALALKTALQIGVFAAPTVLSGVAYTYDKLSGKKTNLNLGLSAVIAGLAATDMSFLPAGFAAPLVSGLGVAGLLTNTRWTNRR